MVNYKLEVFECITGEHTGKQFVHYSEGAYRLVENSKVNRYPYFNFKMEEVKDTGVKIDNVFNLQVKFDCEKYQQLTRNKELARKALVVAHRIIKHNTQFDQFKIEYDYHWSKDELCDFVTVYQTQVGSMGVEVARIGFEVEGEDVYVICDKLHRKKTAYGMRMDYDMFDHRVLGVKYKKLINLNELNDLKLIIR